MAFRCLVCARGGVGGGFAGVRGSSIGSTPRAYGLVGGWDLCLNPREDVGKQTQIHMPARFAVEVGHP